MVCFTSHLVKPSLREVRAAMEVAMEECCLLVSLSWVAQYAFLNYSGSPTCGKYHPFSGWHPHTNHQLENASKSFPQANLVGAFSQLRFSIPKWLQLVSSWHKNLNRTCPKFGQLLLMEVRMKRLFDFLILVFLVSLSILFLRLKMDFF